MAEADIVSHIVEFMAFASLPVLLCSLLQTTPRQIIWTERLVASFGFAIFALHVPEVLELWLHPSSDSPMLPEHRSPLPPWYAGFFAASELAMASGPLVLTCGCLRALWSGWPMRVHLRMLWLGTAITNFWLGSASVLTQIVDTASGADLEPHYVATRCLSAALFLAVGGVTALPRTRVVVQAYLARKGGEAANAAAAIAALIGQRSPAEVMALARREFCCVSLEMVERHMMARNTPDPSLRRWTKNATLGDVDAFVSHSWHDDPEAKWEALQAWRGKFKERHRREPRVWLDKFCIDQGNIVESLAGLPIYLGGCDKLVVLCGPTYQSRLWCMVELFTFVNMGGVRSNFEVYYLGGSTGFGNFDAGKAVCHREDDRLHLLDVIEAGSGTIDDFNMEIVSLAEGFDKQSSYASESPSARGNESLPEQAAQEEGPNLQGAVQIPEASECAPQPLTGLHPVLKMSL